MAKDSGIGTIIGLGIAGVGVWFLGDMLGWWGGTAAITTTGTTTTTTPTATVQLASSVAPTANNALQATFVINGASEEIAVIPNGDAYNNSGEDITATLAAEGVTPAQLYAMMAAAYTPPVATAPASTASATTANAGTIMRPGSPNAAALNRVIILRSQGGVPMGRGGAAVAQSGVSGLGQYRHTMTRATRRNYVRRGTAF